MTVSTRRSKLQQQPSTQSETTLQTQLAQAEESLQHTLAAAQTLHGQWRCHLFRLSLLLAVLGMHQAQGPVKACLVDIKTVNERLDVPWTGLQAAATTIGDSMEQLVGLVMALCLCAFTSQWQMPLDLTAASYVVAGSCIPVILSLHFGRQSVGCIDALLQEHGLEPYERKPSFPVVLIFYVILTSCHWFMGNQIKQHEANLENLERLKQDLEKKK